jgi:hypothetical protein
MSAFKTLLASDIIVTPVTYNKSFSFRGNAALTASDVGIDIALGTNTVGSVASHLNTNYSSSNYSVYNSVKQLYYTNFLITSSGDPAVVTQDINGVLLNLRNGVTASTLDQPNFDNYLQSTLTPNRYFPTASDSQIAVISIPNKLYGDYIVPGTFNLDYQASGELVSLYDDKEGNVFITSTAYSLENEYVGNIIYSHGIAAITLNKNTDNGLIVELTEVVINKNISFQSAYTIFETQIKCTVGASDYTTTLNPSLISSSEGQVYDFATGSYFAPYVTTVGLYNENQDLLMVGKLAQPLQTSQTTDTTILINIDR